VPMISVEMEPVGWNQIR